MSRERVSEVGLLEASVRGDTAAFEVLVRKYQSFICGITFSATGDIERSEELAQETFVSAWRDLVQLKDFSKFRSWLGSIARNRVRDSLKKQQRDPMSKAVGIEQIADAGASDSGPTEIAISKEQQAVVLEALRQIPEKYREPLVLFYRQEQSVKEVAEQLELSEDLVKQRLSRGRKLLRSQVAEVVETAIRRSGPGRAFTAGVAAAISGMVVKGSAAAAVGTAVSSGGGSTGVTAILSGAAAKLVTAAAVVVVGVGAVVAYKQITKPAELPVSTYAPVVVEDTEEVAAAANEETSEPGGEEIASASGSGEAEGHSTNAEPVVKIVQPEPVRVAKAEYVFKAQGVLSGLITDAVTGEPVTDAHVHVSTPVYESTTTDGNGFYSFESMDGYGDCGVTVFSKRYVGITDRDRERVLLEEGKQAVRHFELERACRVQLRVVNEAGEPVEKARFVSTWLADKDKRHVGDQINSNRTDAEGYALLGGFAPAETPYLIVTTHRVDGEMADRDGVMVHMTHWDYAPEPLEVTLTDPNVIEYREIVLQKGLEVRGYAEYMDGVPAGDLEIGAEPDWWHCWNVPESYPVDANGYFTLKYILPGTHELSAHFPRDPDGSGRSLTVKEAELPTEDGELFVVTVPERSPGSLASISGKVTFVDGVKPRYISITAHSPQLKTGHADLGQDRSGNLRTEFVIDRLRPGVYRLTFRGDGIEKKTVRNVQAPSAGIVIELEGRKQVHIKGKVVEKATGEPITDFKVMAYGERDWVHVSDAQGQFAIEVTGLEDRKVVVSADGYASKISGPIVPDSNERVVIELGIGGAIEGRVVDEKGVPIEGMSISYRYKQSRDESPDAKLITTSDVNGLFVIEEIPVHKSQHWYVFEHADFATELKLIEVEGDIVISTEIVLSTGGSVEGHVYDEQGRPAAGTTLYFMSEAQFSYWNENRSRLSAVRTDEQGYYRIDHLPERLCFGFRGDPDKTQDATLMSILPRRSEVRRLDFGGSWRAMGRLLKDGEPLADTQMRLSGNIVEYETAFTAYARTDSEGRFIFRGVPSGRRHLYWSIPGLRSWGQWSEAGVFEFSSGADLDLGDIEVFLGQVSVEVVTEEPNEVLSELEISIERYSEKQFWGRKSGTLMPRSNVDDKYVFSNLTAGVYEVKARRPSYPTVRRVFSIEHGQYDHEVKLLIPAGTSSLAGEILGSESVGLMLRNVNQTLTVQIPRSAEGSYAVENLPAGDYIIGKIWHALGRQSKLKQFSIDVDEQKTLDIEVVETESRPKGYLRVQIVTEAGLPLAGTDVWLERGGEKVVPHFDSDKSKSFAGEPGEWVLHAEYPGYRPVVEKVSVKSSEEHNTQGILEPLVVTMFKQ